MYSRFFIITVFIFNITAILAGEWKSTFTDVKNDCVVISSSTSEAPIDFFEAECKSFGGYQLYISGGDLRYSPVLKFEGTSIDLQRPWQFHELATHHFEWIYHIEVDNEGSGKLEWKGLIYKLSIAVEDNTDEASYFPVKLDGKKSCLLGKTQDRMAAQELIYNQNVECKSVSFENLN